MVFTYTDYMSGDYSPAIRVSRCRSFIAELTAAAAKPDLSSDGRSISYGGLQAMLAQAKADLKELESDPRAMRYGGTSRGVFH